MPAEQLHIVESESTTDDTTEESTIEQPSRQQRYDQAGPIDKSRLPDERRPRRFVNAVLEEIEKDSTVFDGRFVDEVVETDDVEFGELLVFEDESLLFVGSDPTTADAVPLFAFVIEPYEPVPGPETAKDALDLLKPSEIKRTLEEEDYDPPRQGEWWLQPTQQVPLGSTFTPGVAQRPYGPSPLGNHVPREYGFGVRDREFVERFYERVEQAPSSLESVPEIIDWTERQQRKRFPPDYAPDWDDIRSIGEKVFVRGTLRHRENDHFVENVGDDWHEAQTHNIDVYTGDDYLSRVRID